MKKFLGGAALALSLFGLPSTGMSQVQQKQGDVLQENFIVGNNTVKELLEEIKNKEIKWNEASFILVNLIYEEKLYLDETRELKPNYEHINTALSNYQESADELYDTINKLNDAEPRIGKELNLLVGTINSQTQQINELVDTFQEMVNLLK